MAMMAMTTNNSMGLKAELMDFWRFIFGEIRVKNVKMKLACPIWHYKKIQHAG